MLRGKERSSVGENLYTQTRRWRTGRGGGWEKAEARWELEAWPLEQVDAELGNEGTRPKGRAWGWKSGH